MVLTAFACTSPEEHIGRRLDAAEAAMNENPEEALEILGSIDSESIRFTPRRARYALLLSQALDKNYLDVEDDSLIMIAVNFYRKWFDNERFAQSLYYVGRVHFNAKDYTGAIVYSTQAAETTQDHYLDSFQGCWQIVITRTGMILKQESIMLWQPDISYTRERIGMQDLKWHQEPECL